MGEILEENAGQSAWLAPSDAQTYSADTPYIVWQAESTPLTIEFSRLALEQIRQVCFAATNGIQRGGKGVGGLLFGTRIGSHWRVIAWRPIVCSYPRGEAFHLSGNDELMLEAKLGEAPPGGTNLLGWFASHPRGGLLLSPQERHLHGVFFSATERLMLTMRATRAGELAIVVHAPESQQGGSLHPYKPELRVQPMPRREFESAAQGALVREDFIKPAPARQPVLPAAQSTYFAVGFSGMLVITAALSVLGWQLSQTGLLPAADVFVARLSPPTRLLSVHASHRALRLNVVWDPRAFQAKQPSFAVIKFVAGSTERSLELDSAALKAGSLSIALDHLPLSVTMIVRTANGGALKETVRIAPSAVAAEIASVPLKSRRGGRLRKN